MPLYRHWHIPSPPARGVHQRSCVCIISGYAAVEETCENYVLKAPILLSCINKSIAQVGLIVSFQFADHLNIYQNVELDWGSVLRVNEKINFLCMRLISLILKVSWF